MLKVLSELQWGGEVTFIQDLDAEKRQVQDADLLATVRQTGFCILCSSNA